MRRSILVLLLLVPLPLPAQSLADLARQERERREKIQAARSYDNRDLEAMRDGGRISTGERREREVLPEGAPPDAGKWRGQIERAELRVERLRRVIKDYDEKIELERRSFAGKLQGLAARERRLRRLRDARRKAERELEDALEDKRQLERRARRAGLLPGQLRE